jgi:preprotein translocase subunit SecE
MLERLINYFKGTRMELGQVNWPTKNQTINYTLLIVGVSGFVALFLGLFDMLFSFVLKTFVL